MLTHVNMRRLCGHRLVQKAKTFPEVIKEGLIGTSRVAEDSNSRPGRAVVFRDIPGPELVRSREC